VEKLRRFPVHLRQEGRSYDEAAQTAHHIANESGAVYVPAYDDVAVIAGQATIGLEILAERPETEVILTPVGGGGLIAGVAAVAHALSPACRVIGIGPAASPSALLSLRDGKAYDPYDAGPTIADGLAGGFGALPLAVAGRLIDSIILAEEAELREAIFVLLDQEQLVVEGSGAAAIVPLLNGSAELQGKTVVCVLSGGNLETALLKQILHERGHL
jgi:threonine dehydratase